MTILAFGSLFAGMIGMIFIDIFVIFADPQLGFKFLITDVAKTLFVSQAQISEAVKEFGGASPEYSEFLFWRIIAGSLVTIGILWLGYKFFSFFVPSVKTDLGARLMVICIVILIIWMISLVYSVSTDQGFILPFSGWIDLIKHSPEIRSYMEQRYSERLNQTVV